MKNIVITTGTYNLLHPGHIEFFENASKLGDELHVFLDVDERNKRLKKEKAIFDFSERSKILSSIKFIKKVHSYDGPGDEFNLCLASLRSTYNQLIFVKGGDYNFSTIDLEQANCIKKFGGIIVFVEYNEKYSTTATIKKIKELGNKK